MSSELHEWPILIQQDITLYFIFIECLYKQSVNLRIGLEFERETSI